MSRSSTMMSLSETLSEEANKLYSLTPTDLFHYIWPLSCPMESKTPMADNKPRCEGRPKSAIASITKVATQPLVDTDTSVRSVEATIMDNKIVDQPPRIELYGMQPKYLRYNVWNPDGNLAITTPEWTENAVPLLQPPSVQLMHPIVNEMITKNPDLFKIVRALSGRKRVIYRNQRFVGNRTS